MSQSLLLLAAGLGVVALVTIVAPRLRTPAPILLALAGVLVAEFGPFEHIEIDPELVLVGFLPPLLYSDAFHTSWLDFRRWLRPILMLAIGLVALTIVSVGFAAHVFLPELPLAACFLLGAIVSPTDTVATQAVIERLRVPRRMTAILGGESLVNDATGLVGVQLALAVLVSGVFDAGAVTLSFARVAGLGVAIGLGIGALFALANKLVRDTKALFALSLLAPYLAFVIAYELDVSGVLAVVAAGFVVAWRIHDVEAKSRVELYSAWDLLTYLFNGFCFVYIGLETPWLVHELSPVGDRHVLIAGLVIALVCIVARFVWCFPGAYLPLLVAPKLREREGGLPPWRNVTIVSWCGVRGAVSLAAALAVPATFADGTPFEGRRVIVACTLIVILVTLFAQGLTLQPLVHALGLREDDADEHELSLARERILSAGIARLDAYCSETSCPIAVYRFRSAMSDELAALTASDAAQQKEAAERVAVSAEVRREVHASQERALLELRDRGAINDKTYVALQLELDRAQDDGKR
ncbi:MAG: Na+/H+ antiporter [Planctomycetes bacterium]|nr:Na+/H+ antiporter [Planctomycetota bacterium]